MGFTTAADGARVSYEDRGLKDAQPVVFPHGWSLRSDARGGQRLLVSR